MAPEVMQQHPGVVIRRAEEARRIERARPLVVPHGRRIRRRQLGAGHRSINRVRPALQLHRTRPTEVRVGQYRLHLSVVGKFTECLDHLRVFTRRPAILAGFLQRLCCCLRNAREVELPTHLGRRRPHPDRLPIDGFAHDEVREHNQQQRELRTPGSAPRSHGFLGAASPPVLSDAGNGVYSCRCTLAVLTRASRAFSRNSESVPVRSRQVNPPSSQA